MANKNCKKSIRGCQIANCIMKLHSLKSCGAGGEELWPPRPWPLGQRRWEDGRWPNAGDRDVESWKTKKLGGGLQWCIGMKALIIPPKDQISRVAKMLADEFGAVSNMKSQLNRLSVLGALNNPARWPGCLLWYTVTEEGKEKKVNTDFEPFKPINTSLYLCDNKFHPGALTALLPEGSKFGFIVIDGSGALFGTLQGNTSEILHKFTLDFPWKYGRGGQSALSFTGLRMEKWPSYVQKAAETAVQLFIYGHKVNVAGLVLAVLVDVKLN